MSSADKPPSESPATNPPAPTRVASPPETVAPTSSSSSSSTSVPPVNPSKPAAAPTAAAGKPPLEPLTGFRSALEHTGLPRGVLTWKPRLPSRNWCIFWTVLGTVTYLYYDDRKKCDQIKERTIERVQGHSKEATGGALDVVRKVKVYGARWPEDDDADRALRYFRKYVKPYLVAAAVDYEQVPAPLHGSITRQVHAQILARRRRALGLEQSDQTLSLPGMLDPAELQRREVEGGAIVVGRHSLKEYMEGLRRGWTGGVDSWNWEKEVEEKLKFDGVFESTPPEAQGLTTDEPLFEPDGTSTAGATPQQPAGPVLPSSLSFLSRPPPPVSPPAGLDPAQTIPPQFHQPPNPLPPTPAVLLLPFTSHLGFKQIPSMIYDFFTERYKVQAGAEAAIALIEKSVRPFQPSDLEFDVESEGWYKKDWATMPEKVAKARKEYYDDLKTKINDTRALVSGDRQLSEEEKKSTKPLVTEDDLKEQRQKKELRWMGQLEGWDIVQKDQPVSWDPRFEGWLKVYESPREGFSEPQA